MLNMLPGNSFPQICVVSEVECRLPVQIAQEYLGFGILVTNLTREAVTH
jgi:hypothetical protein